MTKSEAQQRADQIRAFQAEVAALAREGVPLWSGEQAALVAAHHDALLASLSAHFDIDRTDAGRRMSLGMRLASTFGAAALTAAIVSFFYRIWGSLAEPMQVVLLTLAPLTALTAMVVAAKRERTLYVSSLCAIVACGAFALQIVMLGDLYNLRSTPHAVLLWAAFGFAVSLPYRFVLPFAGALAAAVIWAAALVMYALGAPWTYFGSRMESLLVPASVVYFGWPRFPHELQAWARGTTIAIALAALLGLSTFAASSMLPLSDRLASGLYQVIAVAAAFAGVAHGLRTGRRETLVLSAVFAGLFLLGRFVDWWWEWMPKYLFFLILATLALASLWVLRRLRLRFGGLA